MRGGIAVRVCFCGWSSWCLCGGVGVAGVSDAVVVGVGLVLVGYGGAVAVSYTHLTLPTNREV